MLKCWQQNLKKNAGNQVYILVVIINEGYCMIYISKKNVFILFCFTLTHFGCISSTLVNKWTNPSFLDAPLQKILVIAVKKDATRRRIWEDAFTGELNRQGVTATSSYQLFPDTPPDTDQVITAVKDKGFDGIIAILILPTETIKEFYPGYTAYVQNARYIPYYESYWQRYRTYYRIIEHPGFIDSQAVDFRAIDVSTTANGIRLIWSATSRTPDPAEVTDVQKGIVHLVLDELEHQRIISFNKE